MSFSKRLSLIAGALTLLAAALLRGLDPQLTVFATELGTAAFSEAYRAYANGLFLLTGIFWVGAVDSVRKALDPKPFDPLLRFSGLAFAASFLVAVVFPSAESPIIGAVALLLYASPMLFALRCLWLPANKALKTSALVLLVIGGLAVLDLVVLHWLPGLWLRAAEACFVWLWWQTVRHYLETR